MKSYRSKGGLVRGAREKATVGGECGIHYLPARRSHAEVGARLFFRWCVLAAAAFFCAATLFSILM